MMTLAPPAEGAGKAGKPLPFPLDCDAAAGVGPAWKGDAPSETGADSRRTLIRRCSKRTSVKNLA